MHTFSHKILWETPRFSFRPAISKNSVPPDGSLEMGLKSLTTAKPA